MSEVLIKPVPFVYKPKTYEDIFLEMLISAFGKGFLSNDENFLEYVYQNKKINNTFVLDLSVYAYRISKMYEDLTAIYYSNVIEKAQEEDLVRIGSMFLQRRPAQNAIGEIMYGRDEAAEYNIIIPKGSRFTKEIGDNPPIYETTEDAMILQGGYYTVIPSKCIVSGDIGNTPADTLHKMIDVIQDVDGINNLERFTGGTEIEDIEEYRARLSRWKYILKMGTYDAFVEAITNVSAVEGYYIDRMWDGAGTSKIIIDPPTPTVLSLVDLGVGVVKANDEDIRIKGVEVISLALSIIANISLDETYPYSQAQKDEISRKIVVALTTYINGGINFDGSEQKALGIGNDFIPFKAGVYLASQIPEIKSVEFIYPLIPVAILSHQKAEAGNITATVV